MGNINIPQRQSETNFESMPTREAGQVRKMSDLVGLLQNSKLDALELFAQTGLPEIYYAETLKKFLIDPQNAKSIDKFTSIYRDLSTDLQTFNFRRCFMIFVKIN